MKKLLLSLLMAPAILSAEYTEDFYKEVQERAIFIQEMAQKGTNLNTDMKYYYKGMMRAYNDVMIMILEERAINNKESK